MICYYLIKHFLGYLSLFFYYHCLSRVFLFFTRYISFDHSDTKLAFFRHTNQGKINIIQDLFVSATHYHEIWELVLPTLLHKGHKRTFKWSYGWNHELKVKTYIKQISCDAKSICFDPFTRCFNTSRRGRGMVVPNSVNQSNLFLYSPKSQNTIRLRGLHKLHRCDILCLHGRRDSVHFENRKCIPCHTLGTRYAGVSCVILALFG